MNGFKNRSHISIALVLFLFSQIFLLSDQAGAIPDEKWKMYESAEDAGWSSEKLNKAENYFKKLNASAGMIIYKGAILDAWGDIERRFMCHSIRKSILNVLIGIHVQSGGMNLNKTLEDLNIDDIFPLTPIEKRARVIDLLMARSGVYHPAAYETKSMQQSRPKRSSHKPGTFWYYNNWDFNTLCRIFEQETSLDFFKEFQKKIAIPLKMEDFRILDTYYHYERQNSRYPAYPFRMSTRDLARFGLLVLNKGKWGNKHIVPEEWIGISTTLYSETGWRRGGYGYLWWVNQMPQFKKLGMFSALGAGGKHRIDILPGADLVFVCRFDTFKRIKVSETQIMHLLKLILDAKQRNISVSPNLECFPEIKRDSKYYELDKQSKIKFVMEYELTNGFRLTVSLLKNDLILDSPEMGKFRLLALTKTKFKIEDMNGLVVFYLGGNGNPKDIVIHYPSGLIEKGVPSKVIKIPLEN